MSRQTLKALKLPRINIEKLTKIKEPSIRIIPTSFVPYRIFRKAFRRSAILSMSAVQLCEHLHFLTSMHLCRKHIYRAEYLQLAFLRKATNEVQKNFLLQSKICFKKLIERSFEIDTRARWILQKLVVTVISYRYPGLCTRALLQGKLLDADLKWSCESETHPAL